MNKIRYLLTMLMCLIWHINTYGQSDFNPTSPSEPGVPQIKYKLTLMANPNDGGSVSGGGSYVEGNTVTLRATASSGYMFEAWSDENGIVLSTKTTFSYVKKAEHETLYAHFRFVPASPDEPYEPSATLYYRLSVEPDQGCTVSGGGRYMATKSINVSAAVETGYCFVNWTNEKGEVVSTSRSFSYTKKAENEVLTAHCRFDPSAPSEPGDPILRHKVLATSTDGGTISGSTNTSVLEGNSFSLKASVNTGYKFLGWYLDGELYTSLLSFSYIMGKSDLSFEARFLFDPLSPSEPAMPALSTYSYYLMTINGKPGDVVNYPINLVNTEVVRDLNIRLTFPAGIEVYPDDYILSDKAIGYTITIAEAEDDISIIEEGSRLWDFTFIGGEVLPATQALLTFKVKIPDDMQTGESHQVKINQISMTQNDGTTVTAHTRNGRIGVYKWGDSNGDDVIDASDVLNVVKVATDQETNVFIKEVSDMDGNDEIDSSDVLGIVNIATNEDE